MLMAPDALAPGQPHCLPAPLYVTLTSYPPRFPTLHLTLRSLLRQSLRPDAILLWIAHEDMALLPDEVRSLAGDLLKILPCEDRRSFKKILNSLGDHPDAFLVTCDDDCYYPPRWLEALVGAHVPGERSVICMRAHRPLPAAEGGFAPYRQWQREVVDEASARPSDSLYPTGNGGVLYPPGALPAETLDWSLIQRLCPNCDDMWLYFQRRHNGWRAKRAPGPARDYPAWPDTQEESLTIALRDGSKDRYCRALAHHFGIGPSGR